MMLDAAGGSTELPLAIVVGRTLSSYSVPQVTGNQVTITYTVYNQQAAAESGVLLTTTLQPGVTYAQASLPANQIGQELAWSLGTIPGYGRASVSVTVNLGSNGPLQLDSGAQVFATLAGGLIKDHTPAAVLSDHAAPDGWLAATPDANSLNPFIQEEAARLDYDPQRIFDTLHQTIGYNAYAGSTRGALGTLWDGDGNALDVASLGVALMRASGIPATYAQGTLTTAQAQQLIRSMFPATYQNVGYIPNGTDVSDPANDPALLALATPHYWFQFDAGTGLVNADPLMTATLGQSAASPTGTFTEVADALRSKTRIQVDAEIYSQAGALFGGSGLSTSTVLDLTFNDVSLVGRPLTIGNDVSTTGGGFVFTALSHTYSPYVIVAGDSADPKDDQVVYGTDYQEVLTNFPLGSQILTGVFLHVTLIAPDGTTTTTTKPLADRLGPAIRMNGGSPNLTFNDSTPPLLNSLDLTTIGVSPGGMNSALVNSYQPSLDRLSAELDAFHQKVEANYAGSETLSPSDAAQANALLSRMLIAIARSRLALFQSISDEFMDQFAADARTVSYYATPRLSVISSRTASDPSNGSALILDIDLIKDDVKTIAYPGQNIAAPIAFLMERGFINTSLESTLFGQASPTLPTSSPNDPITFQISAQSVFGAAVDQNIPLTILGRQDLARVGALPFSDVVKALITQELMDDQVVIVPTQTITVNGEQRVAWYKIDPVTGNTVGMLDNGSHEGIFGYVFRTLIMPLGLFELGYFAATLELNILNGIKQILISTLVSQFGPIAAKAYAISTLVAAIKATEAIVDEFKVGYSLAFRLGYYFGIAMGLPNLFADPPVPPFLKGATGSVAPPSNSAGTTIQATASRPAGSVQGSIASSNLQVSGSIAASWTSENVTSRFLASNLSAGSAVVRDPSGQIVGNGAVSISNASAIQLAINGTVNYQLSGQGKLAVYGPAAPGLGVSGDWLTYAANATGALTIVLTTAGMIVGGVTLPAGTYVITTNQATFSGSGAAASPSYTGQVAVNASSAALNLGDSSSGGLTVGGQAVNPAQGITFTGFTGAIAVSRASTSLAVAIDGSSSQAIQLGSSAASLTTDQNTPVTFTPIVQSSLAGDYTLEVQAPESWGIAISSAGAITATPLVAMQGGTFPIKVIARSVTNPDLAVESIVTITISATQPGIDFNVVSDPIFTVPLGQAEVPSAFLATIKNLGPASDTYNLTYSNLPSGFSILNSGDSVTVPASREGIIGVYLQVNPGQTLPPPGTVVTFTVTATSTTNPGITKSQVVSFTMPAVHAVSLTSSLPVIATTPGTSVPATITITNQGNVAESNIVLTAALPPGVTITGLATQSLAPGQSVTLPITVTPAASIPLGTSLRSTITAAYGTSGTPLTQTLDLPIRVVVPGADAIAEAAATARQLSNTLLADRLQDLSTALTTLVQTPSDAVAKSQAVASLDAVIAILGTDPFLAQVGSSLGANRAAIQAATTSSAVQTAVVNLGQTLDQLNGLLEAEANHKFTLSLLTNSQTGSPLSPVTYQVSLQNTGSQATTYHFSLAGLPSNVTGSISPSSITLQPGQVTPGTGVDSVIVTITVDASGELTPFSFNIIATTDGTPALTRSTTALFTPRASTVQVVSVTADPTFANPGGQVAIEARILNAVNKAQQARVYYTITDAGNNLLYTSTPVTTTLSVLTTLTTVDLGSLDTTGFALGTDFINVFVTDLSGTPIPGATGRGTLLIGTPVTATLTTSPATVPSGTSTVTNTLTVQSQTTLVGPLGVVSVTTKPDAIGVVQYGNVAYVGGSSSVEAFDFTNPASPQSIRTFGGPATQLEVHDDKLYALQRIGPGGRTFLRIYSLADPTNPALLGSATYEGQEGIPYGLAWHMVVTDDYVFVSNWGFTFLQPNDIKYQIGEIIAIDVSDPTTPHFVSALRNTYGTNNDGIGQYLNVDNNGGEGPLWEIVQVDANTLLVAGSTVAGDDTQNGKGVVHVVDISDPSQMTIVRSAEIPGTVQAVGLSIEGNRAFVTGSTSGWEDLGSMNFTGDTVLAVLDISDPRNPAVLGTKTLDRASTNPADQFTASLGNGLFVFSSRNQTPTEEDPELFVVDINDPQNITFNSTDIPDFTLHLAASGNYIFTTSASGLIVYQLDAADAIPATVQVTIPANNGVAYVPDSFSIDPTSITTNPDGSQTLTWNLNLSASSPSQTITWQSTVTDLQPGEFRTVAENASVGFVSQGSAGNLPLPDQAVAGQQILGLTPETRTIAPGESAAYTLKVLNPTTSSVTYALSLLGLPAGWSSLPATVTVAAGGEVDLPFTIQSSPFAPLGDLSFTILASAGGVSGTVGSDLILAGTPIERDGNAHGIVTSIRSASAVAGQGTAANYTLRLVNTGSAVETFNLSAALPPGVAIAFSRTNVTLAPGAINYLDIPFMLTSAAGTAPGALNFSITATSTADAGVSNTTSSTLTVLPQGVSVSITPPSNGPGGQYLVTVTNTGAAADQFDLALAGPAGLVATLGTSAVSLAPGASQTIPISTGAIPFALPGSLGLTVMASSQSSPGIRGLSSAEMRISGTSGMTAQLQPASQVLATPGPASFTIQVQNTGNVGDSFVASIVGTTGPVSAYLVGLDGQPTQAISGFYLPGLATGAISLQTALNAEGQGTVTIQVQSLATGQVTTIVATIASTTPSTPTPTPTPDVVSAPHVETVLRYGIHMAPTTIVLTFSQPLDPSRAQNVALYHLFDPRGRAIPIVSAVYDPVAMTVTLRPRTRINLHQAYTLTVDGTAPYGLTGVTGLFLDGKGTGQPGSDFTSAITWRNLAMPTRQNRLGRGAFRMVNPTPNKAQLPAHPIVTGKNRPFQRTIAFPARSHLADGKMIVMGRRVGMPQR